MRHPPIKENGPAEVGDFDQAQNKPFSVGLTSTSVSEVLPFVNLNSVDTPHYTTPRQSKQWPFPVKGWSGLIDQAAQRCDRATNDNQARRHWWLWFSLISHEGGQR